MEQLSNEDRKIMLYVITLLKEAPLFDAFMNTYQDTTKELISTLIGFKKSDMFNQDNFDEDIFTHICLTDSLKDKIVDYHWEYNEDDFFDNPEEYERKSREISQDLLSAIYVYVTEYIQYTEVELDSFIIFGKNLFYEIRYETSTLSITI